MSNLNFNDGIKEITINNDPNRVLRINTADVGLIDRLKKQLEDIEKEVGEFQNIEIDGNGESTTDEYVEIIRKLNVSLRNGFDEIFHKGASDAVFGNQNPLAMAGGQTIYANFLDAFVEMIKPELTAEVEASQQNMKKYKDALVEQKRAQGANYANHVRKVAH